MSKSEGQGVAVTAANLAQDQADTAHRAAQDAVFAARPTTAAGLVALIDLFKEREVPSLPEPLDGYVADRLPFPRASSDHTGDDAP